MKDSLELIYRNVVENRLSKSDALALIGALGDKRIACDFIHPLLHKNISTLQEQCFHVNIHGRRVFP